MLRDAPLKHFWRWPISFPLLAAVVLATALFVASGLVHGVPILRHDWGLPYSPDGWKAFAVSASSGWDASGIGVRRPYPTLFVLGPVLSAIGLTFGSLVAVGAFLASIAVLFLSAGIRIGLANARSPWFGFSLGLILLFNSWTYEKLVAGHLTMLLSCAACAFLSAELLSSRPRRRIIFLCAYVAAFQIQFAFLVLVVAVIFRWDRKTFMTASAGSVLSLLPSITGILLSQSTLFAIPFTLDWQLANSLPPGAAVLLDGYSQNYTGAAARFLQPATVLLLGCAVVGACFGVYSPEQRWRTLRITLGACAILIYAFGMRSAFAPLYLLSLQFRQTLVFRELFDLLGIVALGYVGLASTAGRVGAIKFFVMLSAAGMITAWIVVPPSRLWLGAGEITPSKVDVSMPNTRFALLPWQQPLTYLGNGSGADPEAYPRARGVTPLNEYESLYPTNAALARFSASGDTRDLEALSVSRIYSRPGFSTNFVLVNRAIPGAIPPRVERPSRTLNPRPELALINTPQASVVPGNLHELYIFDEGRPEKMAQDIAPVIAAQSTSDAKRDWISASIVFSQHPEIASTLGGAFTTSQSARLRIPSYRPARALVHIAGKILTDTGAIVSGTTGWRWAPLHDGHYLTCRGMCAIAAWEVRPMSIPPSRSPSTVMEEPVAFTTYLPFIAHARLPATHDRILLVRNRFDPAWTLLGISHSSHLEISMIFNGFKLPNTSSETSIWLVQTSAAWQYVAMAISIIGMLLSVFWRGWTPRNSVRYRAPMGGTKTP